jgi:hypothetical protein
LETLLGVAEDCVTVAGVALALVVYNDAAFLEILKKPVVLPKIVELKKPERLRV